VIGDRVVGSKCGGAGVEGPVWRGKV